MTVGVFVFPVEAGHIMMFARAIGDPNPRYYTEPPSVASLGAVVAPPTFVEASLHYDPEFPYRPRIGEPWYGSGRDPSSGPPPPPAAGPASSDGTSFHAETHLEYRGVLRAGDLLFARHLSGPSWETNGARGGRLWFRTRIIEFMRSGQLVVRSTTVCVTTEGKVAALGAMKDRTSPAGSGLAGSARAPSCSAPSNGRRTRTAGKPDQREELLVENLTRAQILQYAGASGDFSPQHTDEVWNTQVAGYPTVFAHGMLTMGMTGRVLTDWFGIDRLRTFAMRFLRPVWPGDDLVATATIESAGPPGSSSLIELTVETRNGSGDVVATGSATVERER